MGKQPTKPSKLEEQVTTSDLLKKQHKNNSNQHHENNSNGKQNQRSNKETNCKTTIKPANHKQLNSTLPTKRKQRNQNLFNLSNSHINQYKIEFPPTISFNTRISNGSNSPRRTSQSFRQNVPDPREQATHPHRRRGEESHGSLLRWQQPHGIPSAQLLGVAIHAHVFPRGDAIPRCRQRSGGRHRSGRPEERAEEDSIPG